MNRSPAAIVVVLVGLLLASYSLLAAGRPLSGLVALAGLFGTYWVLREHGARRAGITGVLWFGMWVATLVGDLLFLLLAAILATLIYVGWFRVRPAPV